MSQHRTRGGGGDTGGCYRGGGGGRRCSGAPSAAVIGGRRVTCVASPRSRDPAWERHGVGWVVTGVTGLTQLASRLVRWPGEPPAAEPGRGDSAADLGRRGRATGRQGKRDKLINSSIRSKDQSVFHHLKQKGVRLRERNGLTPATQVLAYDDFCGQNWSYRLIRHI